MKSSLVILLSCIAIAVQSGTYYVSTSGNDENNGSMSQPWKTIQHALNVAIAGDTILVMAGSYKEQLTFRHSGNETEGYIVLKSLSAEQPLLDGSGLGVNTAMIIDSVSYVVIDGFEITFFPENVIWTTRSHHLIFNNLNIHDFQFGMRFEDGCHHVEVSNVDLYRYAANGLGYGVDCSWDSVEIQEPNHDFVFNNCKAHSDLNPTDNVDGFATGHQDPVYGTQYNFTYNHCIAYDVYDGFDMSAENTLLNGCLTYDCKQGGNKLWNNNIRMVNCIGYNHFGSQVELDDATQIPDHHYSVYLQNCTFFGAQSNISVENNVLDSLIMYNCILASGYYHNIWFQMDPVGNTCNYRGDYNIFDVADSVRCIGLGNTEYSLEAWKAHINQDLHSIYVIGAQVIFTDTAAGNFHLRTGSPAVDAGTSSGAPPVDFEGYNRPYGNGVDIGAYELNPLSVVNPSARGRTGLRLVPNPASQYTLLVVPEQGKYLVSVADLTGKTVMIKNIAGSDATHLDVGGMPPGTYLVMVKSLDRNSTWSEKLIVKAQ